MGLGSRFTVLIGMLLVIGVLPAGAAAQGGAVLETQVSDGALQFGDSFTDLATVTGASIGPPPTGTVTFRIYGPDDPTCAGPALATSTDALDDTAPYQAQSDPYEPQAPGTYRVVATYNGDVNYAPVSGVCGDPAEEVVVLAPMADCTQPVAGSPAGDAPSLTEGDDAYDGMGGGDILNGRGGHDCLIGGAGSDQLSGGAGNDTLSGATGGDTLQGGDGDDDLTGGEGSDYLAGGAGDDVIDAFDGSGGDYVTCGTGDDTVYADRGDYVAGDCETVVRGARRGD